MISANGGLPAHRYTPHGTQRWPRGSEPASRVVANPKEKAQDLLRIITENGLENFRMIWKLFLDDIQIERQDWEFLVPEAESAGEGLSEGEMKKILLSKLAPETKAKIRYSQADKKVNGNWTAVRGLPEVMTNMEVREVLSSVSSVVEG